MNLPFPKSACGYLCGIITCSLGGFYSVLTQDGQVFTCKPRGKLRLGAGGPVVGDFVELTPPEGDCEGVIVDIFPRRNSLPRPKIANVDQAVLLFAVCRPQPDWLLLDKLIVIMFLQGIKPLVCFNKKDLGDDDISADLASYRAAGLDVFLLSALDGDGLADLAAALKGKLTVFTGCSGVGKSSLLNALSGELHLTTGDISAKLKRGKHTTRHVEIMLLDDALIADTPGFSLLDLPRQVDADNLASFYPEYQGLPLCRFDGCLHDREPDCAVKSLVGGNPLLLPRYERYLQLLHELKEREEIYQ